MKYLIVFIVLIAITATFFSCKTTCPPDKKIGDILLAPESLTYIPYTGDEKLIFKNDAGDEVVFTSTGFSKEKNRVSIHKICTEVKFDGKSTYEYYEGGNKSIVFFANNKYALNIGIFTNTLRPEQELFYDQMRVDLNTEGTVGTFDLITKVRFTESHEDSEFYILNPVVNIDSITLGNTTYHDVLASKSEEFGQIFYTKEKGLVGFYDWSVLYHLDRIEHP